MYGAGLSLALRVRMRVRECARPRVLVFFRSSLRTLCAYSDAWQAARPPRQKKRLKINMAR